MLCNVGTGRVSVGTTIGGRAIGLSLMAGANREGDWLGTIETDGELKGVSLLRGGEARDSQGNWVEHTGGRKSSVLGIGRVSAGKFG